MTLWGGRFEQPTADLLRQLGDSIGFDWQLYRQDIAGSIAYAGALAGAGVITPGERDALAGGLRQVRDEFDRGAFEFAPGDEDIHTAVERRLHEIVGPVAGKLHTGRSRNDQIATDTRLWALEAIAAAQAGIHDLAAALVDLAAPHTETLMPGFTHLQPAQPVSFAHWLMSHFWPLTRDHDRFADCARRTAVSPLGAGALAGNPYPIDRAALAKSLGFAAVAQNSLDAVADRDFVAEYLFDAALLGVHLSRFAEDVIIYTNPAFGWLRLGEPYTTGSSLMPQKRNPDSMEITRGKSARLIGHVTTLLAVLKGTPTSYDKDLQEDKEPLFDAAHTLRLLLPLMAGVVRSLEPNPARMRAALDPAMLATDLADYLVARGAPFRRAHELAGHAVRAAEARGVALDALTAADLRAISLEFGDDVTAVFDFDRSVAQRAAIGGAAPAAVRAQIEAAREWLAARGADSA
ncbi:MAG: argininosuccinate lyase [Anaerolineae bacterium]|nr:argininosuccinate lyase [Anaerolineae bacterium]